MSDLAVTIVFDLVIAIEVGMILACVLFMCVSSSVFYFIKNEVDFKLVLVCGVGSVIGSLVGTKLLKKLKNNVIDLIFSVVLIVAGVCMIVF